MKKVLFVNYRYPSPKGEMCSFGQHFFLQALDGFEVRGICFGKTSGRLENFEIVRRSSNKLKKIINLFLGIPPRITDTSSKKFQKRLIAIIDQFKPDFIYVEHVVMMHYFLKLHYNSKIVFFDDESVIYIEKFNLRRKIIERIKNFRLQVYEAKSIEKADITITITGEERDLLLKKFNRKIITIPYSHDIGEFNYSWLPGNIINKTLLFVGNFDHFPNLEAVEFLLYKIMPELQKNDSSIRLLIVGRNTNKIGKIRSKNIMVLENVSDIKKYYSECSIFVAPIFSGSGQRIKVMEAAAVGIPMILTSLAALGYNFKPGKDVIIASNKNEFVNGILKIFDNDMTDELLQMSKNVSRNIRNDFSKEIIQNKFRSLFEI